MEDLKKAGINIKTLSDLTQQTLRQAKELLLKRFDAVVYYDNTIYKYGLSKPRKRLIELYKNQRYWIDDLAPSARDRHKKILKEIIQKNSNNLQNQIREEISKKCSIINRLSESQSVA